MGKLSILFILVDQIWIFICGKHFERKFEEINPENLEYVLSGTNHEIAPAAVADKNIGTVAVGEEIQLGDYNLTNVFFKDSTGTPVTVDPYKYTLDAKFGTVIFNDVSGLTMPLEATYTTGAVTQTTIVTDLEEYEMFFKGHNKATKTLVAVRLWRTKKSPETTFPLIHNELGQYKIQDRALSDVEKESDATLGVYGHIVTIPAAA